MSLEVRILELLERLVIKLCGQKSRCTEAEAQYQREEHDGDISVSYKEQCQGDEFYYQYHQSPGEILK